MGAYPLSASAVGCESQPNGWDSAFYTMKPEKTYVYIDSFNLYYGILRVPMAISRGR